MGKLADRLGRRSQRKTAFLRIPRISPGMSRIDVKALADSMVARGYPAWATVLHDSFKNDNKPVPSDSETGADEEVDIETLRNAVVREYEKRLGKKLDRISLT